MKKIFLIVFFPLYALPCFCQTNEWTWVNGDSLATTNAVYGSRGVFATANIPGARENAVSWTDKSGNLWLFSGNGYCGGGGNGDLNELWEYTIGGDEWRWVNGDTTGNPNGVYGTRGIGAPGNKPGGRFYAVSWTDTTGNLWMMGGQGYAASGNSYDYLSDLWKYNIATNQWTWVNGDSTLDGYSVYGTKGIAAAGNKPGGRLGAICWTDHSNNLWLSGGYGYVSLGGPGIMNDLWKYNIATNQWTWVSGDTVNSSTTSMKGIYGTKGTAANTNKPGGRFYSIAGTDNSGNLWLFGGLGYDARGATDDVLSDLWEYNIATNEWTWMSGDSLVDNRGVFGTKGISSSLNKPGGRYQSVSWADNSGNLWLFGGEGYAASGAAAQLNDLWEYNIAGNQWTWISGDSTKNNTGIYGTQGTAAPANKPGSRYTQISWLDHSNNLWLLGGNGYAAVSGGLLNDLWKFSPGSSALIPIAQYSSSVNTVCAGDTVSFTDQSSYSPISWNWTFPGGTPGASAVQNPKVVYDTAGTYNVKLVVSNSGGTDSLIKTSYIVVNPLPVPVVTTADSLICSGDSTQVCTADTFASYSWSTGNTSYCTNAKSAGGYWVTVTDANHCSAVSNHQQISVYPVSSASITVQGDTLSSFGAVSYQWYFNNNPVQDSIGPVYIATQSGEYAVEVTDTNGCKALSNNTQVVVTGVEDFREGNISVYPNPTVNGWQLTVDNSLAGSVLEVFDEQGRLVMKDEIQGTKYEITATALPGGVYYLRVANDKVSVMRKLLKM